MKAFLILAVSACCVFGQVTTAIFYGIVSDSTGAVVPSATVMLTHDEAATAVTRTANESGEFAFDFLRVGTYTLRIEANGFKRHESRGIDLSSGQTVREMFTLEVGAVTETVTVAAAAPLVSTASSEQLQTFEGFKVTELPLGRRNVSSVLRLATGVDIGSNRNLRINGVGSSGTGISVDGTDANSYPEQRGMAQYGARNYIDVMSIDAVQEVQLVRGILPVEYGGVLGGQVNVIAKSGSNRWHGSFSKIISRRCCRREIHLSPRGRPRERRFPSRGSCLTSSAGRPAATSFATNCSSSAPTRGTGNRRRGA